MKQIAVSNIVDDTNTIRISNYTSMCGMFCGCMFNSSRVMSFLTVQFNHIIVMVIKLSN